ncbi:MAG: MBL fold metallo-hydrolase [Marinilabiliales bacterium]
MKLYSIETGYFKLDGGAMFGVVPKIIWNKKYPADENNRISMAMRCLLIDSGDRKILIDSGIGNKHDEKFVRNFNLFGDDSLEKSLQKNKYSFDDITDNILTHLHFDHCGGSVTINPETNKPEPAFKNATYWISKSQWGNAINPNPREKASYFNINYVPLKEAGKVKFVEDNTEIAPGISVRIFNGHTNGQIIPFIKYKNETIVYMADLIPMATHLHLPYIMSYDLRAIDSMKEKEEFLYEAVKNNYILFFEHDFYNECCRVEKTDKGFIAKDTFSLSDI